jgi:uncharacterized protein
MHSSTGRWSTYNTPMDGIRRASAHAIVFQSREGTPELNCCSVNAPRGFGLLSDWGLMKDSAGVVINYYGPSTMTAPLRPGLSVNLTQTTDYPFDGEVSIAVKPSKPAEFAVKLRIPHWSADTIVSVNGRAISSVVAGGYLKIDREWQDGDSISLALDMSLHLWSGEKECKELTSIYAGPILLAYDHRYNLDNAKGGDQVRDDKEWHSASDMLSVPPMDAMSMSPQRVEWHDWLPPLLLLEFTAADGKTVRLCDFGSAGEAGTPYRTWLPVRHSPEPVEFSKTNPLRSSPAACVTS